MYTATFINLLTCYMQQYCPEQLDPSLKPTDSAGHRECRNIEYDFIIVGAGSAGCVLANRLSANPEWKVLLIEAGGDEDYITDVPLLGGHFTGTKYDWNYTTVKQDGVCTETDGHCHFTQGFVMGGSSTIGEMKYTRGNRRDFDGWESMGNTGWNYEQVLPYFKKLENVRRIKELMNSPYHSTKGPITIQYSHFNDTINHIVMQAVLQFGSSFVDFNGPDDIGTNDGQLFLRGANRCSSSKAYLDPIRNRPNLFIFKNTLATKILLDPETKRATGVRCVTGNHHYEVRASKEVILSAGAINSPKLLMLSGIGPRDHLEELDIPVLVDLPVGQQLIDHPHFLMNFRINSNELDYDYDRVKSAIIEYTANKRGVLSAPTCQVYALLNTYNSVNNITNPEEVSPDTLYYPTYTLNGIHDVKKSIISGTITTLDTKSTGTVKLASANYMDPPLIDPSYYKDSYDRNVMLSKMDAIITYLSQPAWRNISLEFIVPDECNFTGTVTEEFFTCYVKYFSIGGLNAMSTARMGPSGSEASVVDPTLVVHTLKNLRVVDASVIPEPPRARPYTATVMIAEKASDMIISTHSHPASH